jgi:hypothetical protein
MPGDTLHQFAVCYGFDSIPQIGIDSLQQSANLVDRGVGANPKNSQITSKAALICCKILVINKLSLQTKTPLQ